MSAYGWAVIVLVLGMIGMLTAIVLMALAAAS